MAHQWNSSRKPIYSTKPRKPMFFSVSGPIFGTQIIVDFSEKCSHLSCGTKLDFWHFQTSKKLRAFGVRHFFFTAKILKIRHQSASPEGILDGTAETKFFWMFFLTNSIDVLLVAQGSVFLKTLDLFFFGKASAPGYDNLNVFWRFGQFHFFISKCYFSENFQKYIKNHHKSVFA